MKLGNSNGNNTGKKYFMRGRDDQHEPLPENRDKADLFNAWFVKNHKQVANFIKGKGIYSDDIFNTTYMRICEKILYSGIDIKDYRNYFHRSYFTNHVQDSIKETRYVAMPAYDNFAAHHTNPHERERMQMQLENDVFDYVYQRYDVRDFEIFKMYITLKPAVNYQTLSDLTHIQVHNIQRIVSRILADIRKNKVLVNRYYEAR